MQLASAYLSLNSSFERALKAYLDHTQIVLNGDATLHISAMLNPMGQVANLANHAQMAQLALQQNGGDVKQEDLDGPDGKKKRKKRNDKPRDPNAPKRPLTAYFRYLGEQRPVIQKEIKDDPEQYKDFDGKPGEISRIATERWNNEPDEQELYKQAYRDQLDEYNKKVEAYKAAGGKVEDLTAVIVEDEVVGEEEDAEGEKVDEQSSSSSRRKTMRKKCHHLHRHRNLLPLPRSLLSRRTRPVLTPPLQLPAPPSPASTPVMLPLPHPARLASARATLLPRMAPRRSVTVSPRPMRRSLPVLIPSLQWRL